MEEETTAILSYSPRQARQDRACVDLCGLYDTKTNKSPNTRIDLNLSCYPMQRRQSRDVINRFTSPCVKIMGLFRAMRFLLKLLADTHQRAHHHNRNAKPTKEQAQV